MFAEHITALGSVPLLAPKRKSERDCHQHNHAYPCCMTRHSTSPAKCCSLSYPPRLVMLPSGSGLKERVNAACAAKMKVTSSIQQQRIHTGSKARLASEQKRAGKAAPRQTLHHPETNFYYSLLPNRLTLSPSMGSKAELPASQMSVSFGMIAEKMLESHPTQNLNSLHAVCRA